MTKTKTRPHMKVAERKRLAAMVPKMMADLGFTAFTDGYGIGYEAPTEWGCPVTVRVELTEHPYMTCRFERASTYEPWRSGDPRNRLFADIPGANPFSGKLNCHPPTAGDTTAEDALFYFDFHLANNVRPVKATGGER